MSCSHSKTSWILAPGREQTILKSWLLLLFLSIPLTNESFDTISLPDITLPHCQSQTAWHNSDKASARLLLTQTRHRPPTVSKRVSLLWRGYLHFLSSPFPRSHTPTLFLELRRDHLAITTIYKAPNLSPTRISCFNSDFPQVIRSRAWIFADDCTLCCFICSSSNQ